MRSSKNNATYKRAKMEDLRLVKHVLHYWKYFYSEKYLEDVYPNIGNLAFRIYDYSHNPPGFYIKDKNTDLQVYVHAGIREYKNYPFWEK